MSTYRLVFLDDSDGREVGSVSFDGPTPHDAFEIARRHCGTSELWLAGDRVFNLRFDDNGLWVIWGGTPHHPEAALMECRSERVK